MDEQEEKQELAVPYKVEFTPQQLQFLRAPWTKTVMGKILGTNNN